MKTSLSLLTGLVLLATNLQAQTTWYMTPTGTGTRNGSSWSHAFSGTPSANIIAIISSTMQPGDTLLIGGSEKPWVDQQPITDSETVLHLPPRDQYYHDRRIQLSGTAGGTPTAPKIIRGVARGYGLPVFFGHQREFTQSGIELTGTCSYLTFEDIEIHRRAIGVEFSGTHKGIQLKGLKAHSIGESAFYIRNTESILIENCTATRYQKFGFRFHFNCKDPVIRDCVADCTQGENDSTNPDHWIRKTSSPIGFDFHEKGKDYPPNTNILLERCISRNNKGLEPSSYPQGDGFMVQQDNIGMTFRKCVADTATDSGYDLKGQALTINDSVAVNCTKSGVKVWYQATFNNFAAVNNGGSSGNTQIRFAESGTFAISGSIVFNNSTLHSGNSGQRGMTFEKPNRSAQFNNCLFTFAGAAGNYVNPVGYPSVTFNPSGTGAAVGRYAYAGTGTNPPQYANPLIPWNGTGTNYDNQTFGLTKGYNSTVVTPLPTKGVISMNLTASSTNSLAATDVVGVVPVPNWNNSTLANGMMTGLVDSHGAALPGTSVSFLFTTYGYTNSTVTHPPPMDDDSKMMRTHRAGSNTTATSVTASGVPYATYDVYVYWGGRAAADSGTASQTIELQLLNSGTYGPGPSFVLKDSNRAWDGTYNVSEATTATDAVDGNEYVVFRNIGKPEFRIQTSGPIRTGISGFQIVEK